MATATATVADFDLLSIWTCSGGTITSGPSTAMASKTFSISGIPSGAAIQSAVFTGNISYPYRPVRKLRINSVDVSPGAQSVPLAPSSTGNGDYVVAFEFQSSGNASLSDGQHIDRVDITSATVTVTYSSEPPGPPPEPDPEIDWDGDRPISVFAPDATQFNNNGLAVLLPLEGRMRSVAGGMCSATMKHPIDATGKWRFLVPGAIVRIPVPEETIGNAFIGMDVDLYRTNQSAALRAGMSEPTTITYPEWSYETAYSVGSKVTCSGWGNYQCLEYDAGSPQIMVPPYNSSWWKKIASGTSGSAVLVQLASGEDLYFIQDEGNGWYKMSTPMGIEGYIRSSYVTFVRHITPEEADERTVRDQLFRIKNVTIDSDKMELDLYAEHVSYDLAAIIIKDTKISQALPSMAISRIMDGLMMPYRGEVATNLTSSSSGTYTGSLNGKNGIFAFLDPDNGIVPQFKARFSRDNWDLFVLQMTHTDRGARLRYGKNVRGISWKRSSENLITRVVPVAKDQDGNDLYLPELYIDSPHVNEHPVVYMHRLAVKGQIGKDDGTDTNTKWTADTLCNEMRTKAQECFSVDHADEIYQEITVDFEQLGDTAEYPWLKTLEHVLLYDLVKAEDERIGLEAELTVTELEWDFIRKKITAVKVSTATDYGLRTVSGYNIGNNSIGSEKLTEAAITEIANLLT